MAEPHAAAAPSAPPAQYYDLTHREAGMGSVVLRYKDSGLTLSSNALEWMSEGARRGHRLHDIRGIRLVLGSLPQSGPFGSCEIAFSNGDLLTVNSLNAWGTPDQEKAPVYRAFLTDLHGRLSPEDRRRITFSAGNSQTRQTVGKVILVVSALFFIALPIVLLLVTGEIKALFITIVGAGLVYPLYRTVRANEPRTYSPDHLPDDLLP